MDRSSCAQEFDYSSRLVFLADWFDASTGNIMKFILYFFPFDSTVEIWFRTKKEIFLRRSLCDGISFKDMFLGNTVRIYGRQVSKIVMGGNKIINFGLKCIQNDSGRS